MNASSLTFALLVVGQINFVDDGLPLSPPPAGGQGAVAEPAFSIYDQAGNGQVYGSPAELPTGAVAPPSATRQSAAPATGIAQESVYGSPYGNPPATIGASQTGDSFSAANNQATLVNVNESVAASAAVLIRQALAARPKSPLSGREVSLQQVIRSNRLGSQNPAAVTAFWTLTRAVAEYHFAADESRYLAELPVPNSPHQQALLAAALAAARAHESEARLAAVGAQFELVEQANLSFDGQLPLPGDTPFVGRYQTHFETLRSRGLAPARLKRIDVTLPAMRQTIESQAEAVFTAEEALAEIQNAYENGQITVNTLLDLHKQLRQHRRNFLTAVGRYNQNIAAYAMAVARPNQPAERLVGMLIETSPDQTTILAGREQRDIRQVSNDEPVTSSVLQADRRR